LVWDTQTHAKGAPHAGVRGQVPESQLEVGSQVGAEAEGVSAGEARRDGVAERQRWLVAELVGPPLCGGRSGQAVEETLRGLGAGRWSDEPQRQFQALAHREGGVAAGNAESEVDQAGVGAVARVRG